MTLFTPATEDEAAAIIRDAMGDRRPLALAGGGTRAGLGRPVQAADTLATTALTGITLYEPAELVIGARAGTPLAEIEAALAGRGQMLPFEPMDHRALYGTAGEPTIGAVAAGNVSGPRRVQAGAARDHLIGVRFVNGRGEVVKSGGRVMKNVTGLDLVKLSAGALGTLGLLTEVVFKVLPRPEARLTLGWHGLDDEAAVALMSAALGSPFEISAAAHLPAAINDGRALTLLRIEAVSYSVEHRAKGLAALLAGHGLPDRLPAETADPLWRAIRDGVPVAADPARAVWRLSLPATHTPAALAAIRDGIAGATWFYDWGGGLAWLAVPADGDAGAVMVRAAIRGLGGHATLVRAPDAVRTSVDVFEPLSEPLMAITRGLKASFDPAGILNPGRMYSAS